VKAASAWQTEMRRVEVFVERSGLRKLKGYLVESSRCVGPSNALDAPSRHSLPDVP
jgi:hypothetical protein